MKLASRLFFIFLISMLLTTSSLKAQVPVPQHQSKSNQSVQSHRQVDEQLARNFFNNKEYDKAADMYQQLYVNYRYYHYFSQYIECLIFLENFKDAEKDLRSFIKNDNTTNKWRSTVTLAYVLFRNNENDKSEKILKKLISELPADKNVFMQVANVMNSKDFNEYSIMLYDRGSSISSMNYKFFMEKAQAYLSMTDFEKATENYLLQLEEDPSDYDVVKTRMSYMLRYNLEDSVIDDIRFALLKKAQENRDNDVFAELLVWFALQMKDYQKMNMLKSDNTMESYSNLEKRIENECIELGVSDKTIPILIIRTDILAFRLDEMDKAIDILNDALLLNISRLNKAKLKMELADIYLLKEEVWEATLLYSQVDKSMKEEPIGHEARFKNAQLRYYMGEFDWSLAVLKILKSATSKLVANDAMSLSLLITDNLEYDTIALKRLAKADYYIYQKRYELANQMLDSVNIYNPNEVSMPYLLTRKAYIAMENKDYELADSLYKRVYQGYADSYIADKALLEDAILLERYLNKKEEAMECYAKLIDEYTASVYVAQARNAYRRIRNSNVN